MVSTVEYQTLPQHDLEQSPCYPIIVKKGEFYRCKVHPKEQNIYLVLNITTHSRLENIWKDVIIRVEYLPKGSPEFNAVEE